MSSQAIGNYSPTKQRGPHRSTGDLLFALDLLFLLRSGGATYHTIRDIVRVDSCRVQIVLFCLVEKGYLERVKVGSETWWVPLKSFKNVPPDSLLPEFRVKVPAGATRPYCTRCGVQNTSRSISEAAIVHRNQKFIHSNEISYRRVGEK